MADSYYGMQHDILVTTLELTPALRRLHFTLLELLAANGAVLKNPQFNGEAYAPHVTVHGDRRLPAGARVEITDVSLASPLSEAANAPRRVLASIPLART